MIIFFPTRLEGPPSNQQILLDIYPTLASLTGCRPPQNQQEEKNRSVLIKKPEASGFFLRIMRFSLNNTYI